MKSAWFGLPVLLVAGLLAGWPIDVCLAAGPKQAAKEKAATRPATRAKASKPDSDTADATASETEDDAEAAKSPFKLPEKVFSTGYNGSYVELISFINAQIRQVWSDNEVRPAEPAEDAEFIRRVHLDIVGHIPDFDTVQKFLADKDKAKRAKLIDKLLDEDEGYVRNFVTIWANNLIGRRPPQQNTGIQRDALEKFLRESFGRNRGWNEIVSDLLTAEGDCREKGAANFLLSHMNDGAVPATAISARLFLGVQVQCTQCHNHPFNEWKQNAFWEFNSFFKQDRAEPIREYNERTGRMDVVGTRLLHSDFGG
ncbi:MAG: DUF1549 domain-containing protein, partial [Planctomycetes bacterium]|nr:DUF1549 domain-containing protein [Planctomycetota bacterium]